MRIIAKRRLMEIAGRHADSLASVERWYALAKAARWSNLADVRKVLPHADLIGDKTVFNIKGNSYRLVVHIRYDVSIIYIKDLLTHSEYDKGGWRDD